MLIDTVFEQARREAALCDGPARVSSGLCRTATSPTIYLSVMASPKRAWHFKNDPAHEWIIEKDR